MRHLALGKTQQSWSITDDPNYPPYLSPTISENTITP